MEQSFYSPKKVAEAIGVSESSLKRWCDKGLLAFSKTAGGHRRIFRAHVIEFVRGSKSRLVNPDVLGLQGLEVNDPINLETALLSLERALLAEDEAAVKKIILSAYVQGWSLPQIFDQLIKTAFEKIGHLWESGQLEVYKERHCIEIVTSVLHELKQLVPEPPENAKLAIGGTLTDDNYSLPNHMVEILLRSHGWNASSLGCNIPVQSMVAAAQNHQPDLFWVSISKISTPEEVVQRVSQLGSSLKPGTTFVIGGRGIPQEVKRQLSGVVICDHTKQLDAIVGNMKSTVTVNYPPVPKPNSN